MSTLYRRWTLFGSVNSNRTLQALLDDFSESMPVAHRRFLRKIRQTVPCGTLYWLLGTKLLLWWTTVREAGSRPSSPHVCVDVVLDFRWRHMQMVRKYVLEPAGTNDAVGTGGTAAFPIYMNISRTQKQLECPC